MGKGLNKIESWDVVIKPKSSWFKLNLRELIRYYDLLVMFIKRDIVTVYKQTVLGPLWYFIQPILTTAVYILVFGKIAGMSTDGLPKPVFYLCGIIIWNYFSECFIKTSDTFLTNQNIFGKIYFPRLIVPISKVVSGLIKFCIQFILFLGFYLYYMFQEGYSYGPTWYLVLLPVLLVLMGMVGLGFGLLFTSLTSKYRDFKFLIQFGVQLVMYASPIIYPLGSLEDGSTLKTVISLNPLSHIIEYFKYAFLGKAEIIDWGIWYSGLFTILVLFIGIIVFNRTEKNFVDTI